MFTIDRSKWLALACLAWAALTPAPAAAWGPDGHDLVGKVADQHLDLRARQAINELLQGHQYQSLSDRRLPNWADAIRSQRRVPGEVSPRWPSGTTSTCRCEARAWRRSTSRAILCGRGLCVLGALKRFRGDAQGRDQADGRIGGRRCSSSPTIVGDLHQPLHCAERDNDRGGNLVRVTTSGDDRHVTNLHKLWDTELVHDAMGPLTVGDYASRLTNALSTERRKAFQKGTLEDWILDSHKIAREKVYKDRGVDHSGPTTAPHTLSGELHRRPGPRPSRSS